MIKTNQFFLQKERVSKIELVIKKGPNWIGKCHKRGSINQKFPTIFKYGSALWGHTMASFCVISYIQFSIGYYPGVHYFLWILLLCTLLLCSITHYDIRMRNDIARDTHCNITMGNDVVREIHCDVTMSNDVVIKHNNVAINLFGYVLLQLIMILLFHHKTLHKSLKSISNQ